MRSVLRLPRVQLALWTLFVWGVRLRNADGAVGATALSLVFLGLALAVLASRRNAAVIATLAGLTAVVWVVRIVDIVLLSDHGVAFTVVHLALGVVSVLLATRALGQVRRARRRTGQPAVAR